MAAALLDANIPQYAAGVPHPYRDACQWIMQQVSRGELEAVTDVEVIQEILHRYGALGRYTEAVVVATDLMMIVPNVLAVSAADVQQAVALFQQYAPQGVKSRDIIHAAVMLNKG